MDVIANGINRNGSRENPTPNSASLILNYRYDNGKLSEVGDKMYVGAVSKNCLKYIWNNRLHIDGQRDGNKMAIGYYEYMNGNRKYGTIAMFDISINYPIDQYVDTSSDYQVFKDGSNDFAIEVSMLNGTPIESFKDIYSFNDLVILETNKNRYCFYYENDNYNLLHMPERFAIEVKDTLPYDYIKLDFASINIPDVSSSNSRQKYVDIHGGGLTPKTSPIFGSYDSYIATVRDAANVMFTKFYDTLKLGDSMIKNFHCVCAVTMVDGEILMLSNVFSFVDLFRFTDGGTLTYLESIINNSGDDYYHTIRAINDNQCVTSNYGEVIPSYNSYSSDVKTYRGVKVSVIEGLDSVKNLYDKGFVKEITVYLTDMISEYDYQRTTISSIPYKNNHNDNCVCRLTCNIGVNEDDNTFNRLFYKVGAIDINTGELELTGKMFNGITNAKSLDINHYIDCQYVSSGNYVYNEMIHKSGLQRISSHYSFPVGDVAVDIKYKDNTTWKRVYIDGTMQYIYASPDNYLALELYNNCIEFNDIDRIEAANLIVWNRVYKKLKIERNDFSHVGYSILLAKEDKSEYSGSNFIPSQSNLPDTKTVCLGVYFNKAIDFNQPSSNETTYHVLKSTRYGETIRVGMKDTWNNVSNTFPNFMAMTTPVTYRYTEGAIIDNLSNSVQVSSTSNPFVMPVQRNYTFGDTSNVVIGCATTSQTISDAKYGQLPLYVITKRGVWVLETGQNDVAYLSSHNISPLNCYEATKMVLGTPYGVVFMSDEGLVLIDSTNKFNNISIGMDGVMNMPCAIDIDNIMGSHVNDVNACHERFVDFISQDSFVVYDKRYGEIIIINPNDSVSYVYTLGGGVWSLRCDATRLFFGTKQKINQFQQAVDINGEIHLISKGISFGETYHEAMAFDAVCRITEYNSVKYVYDSAACEHVIATTPIFAAKYIKVEHLIARFFNRASPDTRYNIGMLILGSKSGVEWQIVGKAVRLSTDTMNSSEVRRMVCSCRYVMFVFVKVPVATEYDATRLDNYFSQYSCDTSTIDPKNR